MLQRARYTQRHGRPQVPRFARMTMKKDLFQTIKRRLFPKWDQGEEWVFERLDDLNGADGQCNIEEKKIQISAAAESTLDAELIVVHEICHAVTTGYHGNSWLKRMEKAALRACKLEMHELAEAIRLEIREYRSKRRLCNADLFYHIVRDLALLNVPAHTEEEILTAAGRTVGLSSDEVVANYPRARRVFDSAQREAMCCCAVGAMMEPALEAQAS